MKQPQSPYRIIYRVVSGNVVGVVEEPQTIRPEESLDAIRMVKIGVLDSGVRLQDDDARYVIEELRAFVTNVASRVSF